ncbi:MAG: valS, partial [Thermoleophilia bacterium]|nr:valS [Thermoleophilia bacterium]
VELEDRWILARLDRVLREVTRAFDAYEFALAVKAIYGFCWNELCDWYLESVKERLRSGDPLVRAEATRTLSFVMDRTIRMIHPVMPHLSEELAVQVWGDGGPDGRLIALDTWHEQGLPEVALAGFAESEARFARLQALVTRLRGLRQSADVKPRVSIAAQLSFDGPAGEATWSGVDGLLRVLANVDATAGVGDAASGAGIALPVEGATLTLFGLDPEVLRPRLEADAKTARAEAKRAEGKLGNEKFTSRAPDEIVQEERDKVTRFTREAEQLDAVLAQL